VYGTHHITAEDPAAVAGDKVVEGVRPRAGQDFQDQHPSGRGGEVSGYARDGRGFCVGVAGVDQDETAFGIGDGVLVNESLAGFAADGNQLKSAGWGVAGEEPAEARAERALGVEENHESVGGGHSK